MILHLAAFLLLQLVGVVSQTHQISGIPSPGNTIHVERELTLSYNRITIKVSSVVPVTVQRYGSMYDSEGEEAVPAYYGKVLVTSDCDTGETSAIPNVVVSDDNSSLVVELDEVPQDGADVMPFLEPSSYSAFWTWKSYDFMCEPSLLYVLAPTLAPTIDIGLPSIVTSSPSPITSSTGSTHISLVSTQLEPPDEARDSTNGAFGTRPFSFCLATTLLATVIVVVFFQRKGDGYPPRGYGKIALVAMAVSSIYSRTSWSSQGGNNIQKSYQGTGPPPPKHPNARNLQACSFNVEIMIDGCTKSVEIVAPAGRVVDAVITNQTSTRISRDECSSTNELSANISFPVTNSTQVFNLLDLAGGNNTAEAYPDFDFLCHLAICNREIPSGRPFVDATGGTLQAMPKIVVGDQSWTGKSLGMINAWRTINTTSQSRYLLVEDWTQRALGEHASVASFSAFSIALMTNQAPSNLVSDALMAGLDEVRHAKTSFEIASMLAGKDVLPGPLPPSNHEFHPDLTALAMAVAQEGCVDETLSAFATAFEVERITQILDKELCDSLYANVDRDTLAFIRDELVKITLDESNHSALAWRTLYWVCTIDSAACDAAYNDVFDEGKLEMRFIQRATASMDKDNSALHFMRSEWKKILHFHRLALSNSDERDVREPSCTEKDVGAVNHSTAPLLASVMNNILRQLTCN